MLNNEQVGISAEVAIANVFGVTISQSYRTRGNAEIIQSIEPFIPEIFASNNIPAPKQHTAERQNVVDFILDGDKTLSLKTNKQALGKSAPQIVGQASSNTWFTHLSDHLGITDIPNSYIEKTAVFKSTVLSQIDKLLSIYWGYMFHCCDYVLHLYNIVDKNDVPTHALKYVVFHKNASPIWDRNKITFTKPEAAQWNESNTVKYGGVTIGEFQVHNHRDNFKFRFNIAGIVRLLQEHQLTFSSDNK